MNEIRRRVKRETASEAAEKQADVAMQLAEIRARGSGPRHGQLATEGRARTGTGAAEECPLRVVIPVEEVSGVDLLTPLIFVNCIVQAPPAKLIKFC